MTYIETEMEPEVSTESDSGGEDEQAAAVEGSMPWELDGAIAELEACRRPTTLRSPSRSRSLRHTRPHTLPGWQAIEEAANVSAAAIAHASVNSRSRNAAGGNMVPGRTVGLEVVVDADQAALHALDAADARAAAEGGAAAERARLVALVRQGAVVLEMDCLSPPDAAEQAVADKALARLRKRSEARAAAARARAAEAKVRPNSSAPPIRPHVSA